MMRAGGKPAGALVRPKEKWSRRGIQGTQAGEPHVGRMDELAAGSPGLPGRASSWSRSPLLAWVCCSVKVPEADSQEPCLSGPGVPAGHFAVVGDRVPGAERAPPSLWALGVGFVQLDSGRQPTEPLPHVAADAELSSLCTLHPPTPIFPGNVGHSDLPRQLEKEDSGLLPVWAGGAQIPRHGCLCASHKSGHLMSWKQEAGTGTRDPLSTCRWGQLLTPRLSLKRWPRVFAAPFWKVLRIMDMTAR